MSTNEEKVTLLMQENLIGFHVKKENPLKKTIEQLPSPFPSYQVFLGNPQSAKMSIDDKELKETAVEVVKDHVKMYVHSQYIINLSNSAEYIGELLGQNLRYARMAGFKGVVVHTGKSVKKSVEDAIDIMEAQLRRAMEYATEDCPILLETPSGQGTETLTNVDDFMAFMERFNGDPRIAVCVDTCHVFASGSDPLEYLQKVVKQTRLIHFNDSKTPCGSCVDRHEMIGEGHIGFKKMKKIAEFAKEHQIDMLYEG